MDANNTVGDIFMNDDFDMSDFNVTSEDEDMDIFSACNIPLCKTRFFTTTT